MASKSKNIQIIVTSKGLKEVKRDLVSIRKLTGPGRNNNIKINLSVNQKFFQTSLQKAFKNIATKKLNLSINQSFFNKSLANAIAQAERRGIRLTANVVGAGRARPEQKRAERISGGAATSNIVGGVAFQRGQLIATKAATNAQLSNNALSKKANTLAARNVKANIAVAKSGQAMSRSINKLNVALSKSEKSDVTNNSQLQNLNRGVSVLNKSIDRLLRSLLQVERTLKISSNSDISGVNHAVKNKPGDSRRRVSRRTALVPGDPVQRTRLNLKGETVTKSPKEYRRDLEARRMRVLLERAQQQGLTSTRLPGRSIDTASGIGATHTSRRNNKKFDTKLQAQSNSNRQQVDSVVGLVKEHKKAAVAISKATSKIKKSSSNMRPPIGGGGGGGGGRGVTGADPYKRNRGIIGTKGGGGDFSHMASGMGGFVGMYAEVAAKTFALSAAFRALKEAADFGVLIDGMKAYEAASGASLLSVAKRVQEITQHTIGLKQASQGVTMSIAAGFDSTQIEAMATAAKNAGLALGRDLGDAFDRITKGVTKAEPELLDELGIILRLETASKKYAKTVVNLDGSIGKSVKELTTYEKQQAVLNEVITQADTKFGLLGKAMEGKANSLSAISAALTDTALTAGNYALEFKILGLASLKDVVKFFSENATAVIAAFAGLATFLVGGMLPKFDKFTKGYAKQAGKFASESYAMNAAIRTSGMEMEEGSQSLKGYMKAMHTGGSNFGGVLANIGSGLDKYGSNISDVVTNITDSFETLENVKSKGLNTGSALADLQSQVSPEVISEVTSAMETEGLSAASATEDAIKRRLGDSVQSQIDMLESTGNRTGRLINEELGIDTQMSRRQLKELRSEILKTTNPVAYQKDLDAMSDAESTRYSRSIRKAEAYVKTRLELSARANSLKANARSEVQLAFEHEGVAAGWEESRFQAKRYGKQMDKLYKNTNRFTKLWGKVKKQVGMAQIHYGQQFGGFGKSLMRGGMKAMQAVAMYTMAEAAVKGIAKSFGLITTKIPKAISGMKAFGEELEAQQDKWIGYRNQLALFTDSLEGIGKAAGQEAQSLESFSNSLASASIKWGQAFEDMTGWEKAGEAFSGFVPWQDSMSESLEEQTKKFAESIKKSGHLKAIADQLEIDTADMKLFDDKGKTTAKLALFQEEVKKSAKFARNLESGIKDLGLAFQGTSDAHSEFAKSLLTSTKFDSLVEQSKGLKKTFDAVFYNTEGVAAFEGTLDKAATAVKDFKDSLGNLSLEVQLVPTSLANITAAELKKISGFQSKMIGLEGILDPLEAIKHNSALNYKIQESVVESNRERQQKHVASQLTGSLLPQLKRAAFSHIPEAEWEKIAEQIIKGVEKRIQNAATVVSPPNAATATLGPSSGLVQAIPESMLQNIVKDVVGKNVTGDMIKQGIYQNAISSQVDDLSIELTSAMETLIGKHEGYLALLHEGITDGISFTAAKDVLKDAIKAYDVYVKNAQRQFRYLQGEIDLLSSSMTRLKNTGTSTDLLKSLNLESKILDSKQDQIRWTIKTLKLSKQTEEIVEAIAQEEAKIADMQLNRLSLTEILHKSITSELKYQYDLYEKTVGRISQMASTLESIGAINKSQVAHLNFVSTKQTSINSASKDLLDLHAKYQRDLVTPGADKDKLTKNYRDKSKALGEQLADTIKIASIERDSSYLDHKLELYNKMLDRASALLDIQEELSGVHGANASTTDSLAIISARDSDLAKERLESTRETTELTERHTLALQNAVGSTTDLTKWYNLEKAHMAFMIETKEKLINLQAIATLNTLKESSYIESINRHLVAQEELNNTKLTSSLHVNNIRARENRLAIIKNKFDTKALQHEHNVLKIKDKLENLELTSWEKQNLLRDINSEILEMEKEKVEVLEEYVEGLKAAHEAKKRIGEASLDDELYYRIKEMQEAMPSTIDSAANVMIGSINTAVDMMAENIKKGEGAFGEGGFEDFAAKQWQAAGDTLIDSAAEKMKVASAKLMLGSGYVSPEEKAVQALKKQDIGNNYLLDISSTLKAIRDRRIKISDNTGTTIDTTEDFYVKNKNKKVFDQFTPDNMSELLINSITAAQDTRLTIAKGVQRLVDLMKPAFELQRLAAEKAAALAAAEAAADRIAENDLTAAEKQFEDLDTEYTDNRWFDLQIKGSNELTKQIRLTVEAQYREVAARERYLDTVREMTTAMTEFVDASLFDKFRNSDAYKGIVQEAPPHLLEKTKYRALPTDDDSNNPNWQDRGDNNRGAEFYAHGGHVSGVGGPTDDSVAAWLSNGEFVVNADATKRNRAFLNIINEGGKIPGFSEGTKSDIIGVELPPSNSIRPDGIIGGGIFDAVDPQVTRILNEVSGHVFTISNLMRTQVTKTVGAIDELATGLTDDLITTIEFEVGVPLQDFMIFIDSEMSPVLANLNTSLTNFNDASNTWDTATSPTKWFSSDAMANKLATGGNVSGPGGPKEDLIPALLSNGEYVINAASTKKHEPLIRAINEDNVSQFVSGGKANDDIAKFNGGGMATTPNTKAIKAIYDGRFSKGIEYSRWPGEITGTKSGIKGAVHYSLQGNKIHSIRMDAPKGGPSSLHLLNELLKSNPGITSIDPGETSPGERFKDRKGYGIKKNIGGGTQAISNWRHLAEKYYGVKVIETISEMESRMIGEAKLQRKEEIEKRIWDRKGTSMRATPGVGLLKAAARFVPGIGAGMLAADFASMYNPFEKEYTSVMEGYGDKKDNKGLSTSYPVKFAGGGIANMHKAGPNFKTFKGASWWVNKEGQRVRNVGKPYGDWQKGMKYNPKGGSAGAHRFGPFSTGNPYAGPTPKLNMHEVGTATNRNRSVSILNQYDKKPDGTFKYAKGYKGVSNGKNEALAIYDKLMAGKDPYRGTRIATGGPYSGLVQQAVKGTRLAKGRAMEQRIWTKGLASRVGGTVLGLPFAGGLAIAELINMIFGNPFVDPPESVMKGFAHGGKAAKAGKAGNAERFVRGMDWNIMGWEDDVVPKDPMGLHKYGYSSKSTGEHDLKDRLKLAFEGLDPDAMANHAPFFYLGNTVGTDPVFALRGRLLGDNIRGVAEQTWDKEGNFQQLATYFSSIEGDMVRTIAHETGHYHPSAQLGWKEVFGDKIDLSWFKTLAADKNDKGGTKEDRKMNHAFVYPDNKIGKELIVRTRERMAVSPMGTSIKDLVPEWLKEYYTQEMWKALTDASIPKKADYDMESLIQTISGKGRKGDTELAHVNSYESSVLRGLGGSGSINPATGLREYAQAGAKVPTVKTKSKVQEDLLTMISKMTEEQSETLKKQLEYFQNTFNFQKGDLNEEQKNWKSFNESDAVRSFEASTGVSAKALVQSFGASFEMELGNLFKTGKFDVKSMLSTFATSVSVAFMNSATAMAVDYVDGLGRDLFSSFLGEGTGKGSTGSSKSIAQLEAADYNYAQQSQKEKPGHKDYWGSLMSTDKTTGQLEADDYLEEMNLFEDKGILGDIKDWGTSIMDSVGGIFDGIEDGAGGIWEKISGFGNSLMKGIGNIFTGENGDGGLMGMLQSGGSWLMNAFGFGSTSIVGEVGVAAFAAGGAAKQGYARFSDGGAIHGAGGPTADAIPAWLSNGEYVINAASTSRYRPIIEAINADELAKGGFAKFARGGFPEYTKYAAGGISGTMTPGPDMAAIKPIPQGSMGKTEVSNNVSVNVNVTNGGASVDVDSDSGNELTQEQSKALGLMIGQKIQEQLIDEQRPGGILSEY